MYMPNFRSGMAARFDSPKDAAHSPRDSLRRVPTTYAAGEWSATPLTEEEAQAEFRDTVHNALGKTCEGKHGVWPGLLRARLCAVAPLSRGFFPLMWQLVAVLSTTCGTQWVLLRVVLALTVRVECRHPVSACPRSDPSGCRRA